MEQSQKSFEAPQFKELAPPLSRKSHKQKIEKKAH
jgi:hypothetical protein